MSSQAVTYDPWADFDDDGDVDIFDIVIYAQMYRMEGEPFAAKAALVYDSGWLDICDKTGQYFNITHNLNSIDIVVDVSGRIVSGSDPHRRYYGGAGEVEAGWITYFFGSLREEAYAVVQANDGGYAIAGVTGSFGAGGGDFWLVKTDADGNMEWNQTYGGLGFEVAKSMVKTSDGGYVMAGYTNSFGAGDFDIWVVKTDADGNMEWNQTYGGINRETAESIIQTSDGGYAITGETFTFGESFGDFWLVKTDGSGNAVWNKTYGALEPMTKLPVYDSANSIIQTADGGYAMAGMSQVIAGIGELHSCWWMVKTDTAGSVQWNQTFDYQFWSAIATCIVQTNDGGYALAGCYGLHELASTALLVKTNATGDLEWFRHHTGEDESAGAYSLVQTEDGGYAMAGFAASPGCSDESLFLLKTNANGYMQWTRTYWGWGTEPWLQSITLTTSGGYIMAGYTSSTGDGKFVVLKTNAFGLMEDFELGLSMIDYTNDTLTFYRGAIDPYWNYLQVQIWKIREAP